MLPHESGIGASSFIISVDGTVTQGGLTGQDKVEKGSCRESSEWRRTTMLWLKVEHKRGGEHVREELRKEVKPH